MPNSANSLEHFDSALNTQSDTLDPESFPAPSWTCHARSRRVAYPAAKTEQTPRLSHRVYVRDVFEAILLSGEGQGVVRDPRQCQ